MTFTKDISPQFSNQGDSLKEASRKLLPLVSFGCRTIHLWSIQDTYEPPRTSEESPPHSSEVHYQSCPTLAELTALLKALHCHCDSSFIEGFEQLIKGSPLKR